MIRTSAKRIIASGDVRKVVDFAIETNRALIATKQELGVVKDYLRRIGLEAQAKTGKNLAEIQGNLGTATIVGVKPEVRPKKGENLLLLEASLPPEVFNALFVKRLVIDITPGFEGKVPSLTPAQRAIVANFVEVHLSTPRVTLPE